jgi:hypothetical protein
MTADKTKDAFDFRRSVLDHFDYAIPIAGDEILGRIENASVFPAGEQLEPWRQRRDKLARLQAELRTLPADAWADASAAATGFMTRYRIPHGIDGSGLGNEILEWSIDGAANARDLLLRLADGYRLGAGMLENWISDRRQRTLADKQARHRDRMLRETLRRRCRGH